MTAPDLLTTFLEPLNRSGVQYMVTGSVASTVYGEPRLTQDIDLVIRLGPGGAERLTDVFPSAEYYLPPLDVLVEEGRREEGGHFNLLHLETGLRADCYVAGDSELNAWGLAHRRRESAAGMALWLAPPEYVILFKLDYFRRGGGAKHLTDIAQMLRVSGDQIDRDELRAWIGRLGLERAWEEVSLA